TAGGGGSHGVPIEKSTSPPSNASPSGLNRSTRSYGYGGGTKPCGETLSVMRSPMLRDASAPGRGRSGRWHDELGQPAGGRVGQAGADHHRTRTFGRRDDLALAMHRRQHVTAVER